MIDVLKKDGIRFKKGDRVYHKSTPQYKGTVRKGNYLGYGALDVQLDSLRTICYDVKDVVKVSNDTKEKPKRLYCKNCGKWTWNRYSNGTLEPRDKAHIPNVGNYCEDCFNKSNK